MQRVCSSVLSSALRGNKFATISNAPAGILMIQQRNLNVHEYQSQALMRKFGVNVSPGREACTPDEAFEVAKELDTPDMVVKAQVLAGGRGLGHFDSGFKGGVQMANTPQEVQEYATRMIGHKLITKQTGPEGKPCNKVLVTQRQFIRKEMYFALLLDRKTNGCLIVGSRKGGMDIEKVAEEDPGAIFKIPLSLSMDMSDSLAQEVATKLGITKHYIDQAAGQLQALFNMFKKCDCTMIEVNPLAETVTGQIMCVDAKVNFDDNAFYRQREIFDMRDFSQEDAREVAAAEHDLNFIGLDGTIGCLVNGAGLAMATLDLIKLKGGSPANFLDIGGGATEKQVTEALKIIAGDPRVKSILINIFGGIMRCDIIALGILAAVRTLNLKVPLVVRLQGTNFEAAAKIIEQSGLRVIAASNLEDAAAKAVQVSNIVEMAEQAQLSVSFELPL